MGQEHMIRKDKILDHLARRGNVAQFIGFEPTRMGPKSTYSRVLGRPVNDAPESHVEALAVLSAASPDQSINIRSFSPDDPRSREFIYGLTDPCEAAAAIERLCASGLFAIANETVDVSDGGVSGVMQGHAIEFSPDDTPRCVEKPGTVYLPASTGLAVLTTVYGFAPELTPASGERTEFSVHPRARGWRSGHTLLWEHESGVEEPAPARPRWPNNFSRMIGDKAFGLLMADALGIPVPRTLVIGRRVAPFSFGRPTGSAEVWTRTCPREPQPGLYTTVKGWLDPFALLGHEDPESGAIASVLRQDAVPATHSGAAIVGSAGELVVEGRAGEGDALMLGASLPEPLPAEVRTRVDAAYAQLGNAFGPVRFEWVDDGTQTWIVQLHVGATSTTGRIVVPGDAAKWVPFDAGHGLPALRRTLGELAPGLGLLVSGAGLTSHVADVLRKAGVPARLADD